MRATISRAELFAFARSLGADPMQTCRIEVLPDRVEVTTFHLDEQGRPHLVNPPGLRKEGDPPDEVATETTVIPIVGDGDATTVRMRHPALDREVDVPATAVGHHAVAGWEVVARETTPEAEPEKSDESEPTPDDDKPKNTPRGRRKSKESE